MSFDKITGQKLAVGILKNSISQQRLSHAYLFTGESGMEKEITAFEFAKAINCEEKEVDACDGCLACRKILNQNHPDVKSIEPEGNYIKIDTIRELQREIIYKPYESNKKLYIINNVELLTAQAANSLLKILEEPPSYAILILLTDNINNLLPTLISRCQIVRFNRINDGLMKDRLEEKYQLEAEKAKLVSNLAGGKFDKAVEMVENNDILDLRDLFMSYIFKLFNEDIVALFNIVEDLSDYKDEIFSFFESLLSFHRDLFFLKLDKADMIINFDYLDDLKEINRGYKLEDLEKAIKLIEEVNNTLRNRNVNLKLTLETLFIALKEIRRCRKN